MGKIFVIMGKSASGKDSIYSRLTDDEIQRDNKLRKCVIYTTRPMREGEAQGREYNFVSDEDYSRLLASGKVIEHRTYETVYGPWNYFTVDDGQFDTGNVAMIGTLESFVQIRDYFGRERVIPIYIHVDDYDRLMRAIERERGQAKPGYVELCRRFIADSRDFSDENINAAGIGRIFVNDDLEKCIGEIEKYISDLKYYE